jgi:hypothetical protein
MPGYAWDPKAQVNGIDKPLKQNDHCFIAGTKVTTDKGDVPIEKLKVGDMVLTRCGFYPIKWVDMTNPDAEIWELRAGDTRLFGTANHPVYVNGKGFIPLDTIRYGDYLLSLNKSCLTGLRSEGIQSQNAEVIASITNLIPDISDKESCISIRKSGSLLMEKSRKDRVSTTLTETRSTTTSQTCYAFQYSHMIVSTHSNITRGIRKRLEHIWIKYDHSQKNGTHQKLGINGILNMLRHGLGRILSPNNAKYAERIIWTSRQITPEDFARITASLHIVGQHTLMMLSGSARTAEKNSQSTNIRNNGVVLDRVALSYLGKSGGKKPVFNLEVNGPNEYFANGILVHNCVDACRYFCHTVMGKGGYFIPKRGLY